ncbi:SGNH/GDSL hydrolase family protein [Dyadobacter bucti]|uniref:SGNH/GDSL hydrolase family protein n=1 Tax=Dyadobacter bucti TaxID=2572203 RepID=UPI003F72773B
MKSALVLSILLSTIAFSAHAQVADSLGYLGSVKQELNAVWPKNRRVNVVFHGHSGPGGSWANHEVHTLESYPNLVLQKLKKKYPYAVINVIVTAVGGENSVSGAARFEAEVLNHKPDVVVIDYTGNDTGPGLEKARAAWEFMIQTAQKNNIKVILVTPGTDQRIDINAAGNAYAQHAAQVRELAATYQTGLADPFATFQKIAKNENFIRDYMASINHFNQKGHEVYASEVFKWF